MEPAYASTHGFHTCVPTPFALLHIPFFLLPARSLKRRAPAREPAHVPVHQRPRPRLRRRQAAIHCNHTTHLVSTTAPADTTASMATYSTLSKDTATTASTATHPTLSKDTATLLYNGAAGCTCQLLSGTQGEASMDTTRPCLERTVCLVAGLLHP